MSDVIVVTKEKEYEQSEDSSLRKKKSKVKWNWKKILKWTGIGLGVAAVSYVGYKFITEPDTDVDDIRVLEKKTLDDMLHTSYEDGRHQHLVDIANWCVAHGKSIVGSYSTKGPGADNAEFWVVAEVVDKKPDGLTDDYLEDIPQNLLRDIEDLRKLQ